MTYKIEEIEGIGPAKAESLALADIKTTDDLLKLCGDAKGRTATGQKTGLSEGQLLKWVNMADLMRVSGIGGEYAELLHASGVDTVKELRTRNAENLAEKAKQINEEKTLTRVVPTASTIAGWITKAEGLEPAVKH